MKRTLNILFIMLIAICTIFATSIISNAENSNADISSMQIHLSQNGATYTGNEIKPNVTLKDSNGQEIAKENYEIKYLRNGKETTDFTNAGTITVKLEGKNSLTGTISTDFVINKAMPSGQPSFTPITTGNKTLKDASLTMKEDSFNVKGTVSWMKEDTTVVEYNKTYVWKFMPDNQNYDVLTGEVEVFSVCKSHQYSNDCDTNCNFCGDGSRIPSEHDFMEIKVIQATKEADGLRVFECQECRFQKEEIIPKIKTLNGWIIVLIIVLVAVVAVGTYIGIKMHREKNQVIEETPKKRKKKRKKRPKKRYKK